MRRAITLRQLEAMQAIVTTGSVNKAALLLNVSQPSVSKTLAQLEDNAGLQLFDRSKGRLQLTDVGEALFREVEVVFAGVSAIDTVADRLRRQSTNRLIIGCTPALSSTLVPQAMALFAASVPEINITVVSGTSQSVAKWVANQEVDVGILTEQVDGEHLNYVPMLGMPMVVVCPLGHRLAQQQVVTIGELAEEPLVTTTPQGFMTREVAALFAGNDLAAKFSIYANTIDSICQMVSSGAGVAILHPMFVRDDAYPLEVMALHPRTEFTFFECRLSRQKGNTLQRSFSNVLHSVAVDWCPRSVRTKPLLNHEPELKGP